MNNGHPPDNDGLEFRIKGGAGSYETAAIAAVIQHSLAEERRVAAPTRRRFSNWMMVARSDPFVPPRPVTNGANGGARPNAPRVSRASRS